jgi:hypothetical protein
MSKVKKYTRSTVVFDGTEVSTPSEDLIGSTWRNLVAGLTPKTLSRAAIRVGVPFVTTYALSGSLVAANQLALFQGVMSASSAINSAIPRGDIRASKLFGRIIVPSAVTALFNSFSSPIRSVETFLTNAVSSILAEELGK